MSYDLTVEVIPDRAARATATGQPARRQPATTRSGCRDER